MKQYSSPGNLIKLLTVVRHLVSNYVCPAKVNFGLFIHRSVEKLFVCDSGKMIKEVYLRFVNVFIDSGSFLFKHSQFMSVTPEEIVEMLITI